MSGAIVSKTINSTFRQLVAEIDVKTIPQKYVEKIIIFYYDGTVDEILNHDIDSPIDVKCNHNSFIASKCTKEMEKYKLYLDLVGLEQDVHEYMDFYFGDFIDPWN